MFSLWLKRFIPILKRYYERVRPTYRTWLVAGLLTTVAALNACTSASDLTPTATSGSSETTIATTALTTTATAQSAIQTITTATAQPTISTTSPALSSFSPSPLPAQIPTVTSGPGPTSSPVAATAGASTGCGQAAPIKPGTSEDETIAARPGGSRGSATRYYRLHLSARYKVGEPQAVLLVFHGHGGNARDMEALTGFSKLADGQGFIAVYPQGIKDDDGLPMWASVGPAADYGIDDLNFTNNLLDKLQKDLCVNPARIYATGFSNGGGMSNYLACRLAGRIAAVVPIAGNYFDLPDGGCQPGRTVALLEIHGTADNVIAYNGRPDKDYPGWPLPAIQTYLAEWATRNDCAKGPQTFLDTSEVKGQQWLDCRNNSAVAHYQIKGGGHAYPDTIAGRPSSEVIWSFLARYVVAP